MQGVLRKVNVITYAKPYLKKNQKSIKLQINRILLCTNPIQVLNARAAMDYNQKQDVIYNDYLVIIHPMLTIRSKELIREAGERLSYNFIYDFSKDFGTILNIISKNYKYKFIPFIGRRQIRERDAGIISILKRIEAVLYKDTNIFEEVYLRQYYGEIEKLVLNTLVKKRLLYGIEDGIANYISKRHRNNISGFIEHYIKSALKWVINNSKSRLWRVNNYNLPYFHIMKRKFTNLKFKNNIVVGEYFIDNLRKLKENECSQKKERVVIIGTVFSQTDYTCWIIKHEIEVYNKVISIIRERHNVRNSQIFYKPHPRITYENWLNKRKNLNCKIYDFNENPIFETELLKNNIKAVYSIYGTSLLIAKGLFNIDSYYIDLRKSNVHIHRNIDAYCDTLNWYGVKKQEV